MFGEKKNVELYHTITTYPHNNPNVEKKTIKMLEEIQVIIKLWSEENISTHKEKS